MELSITIPADVEDRVYEAFCKLAGHAACNDAACLEQQVLRWIGSRVTAWEKMQARLADPVSPLDLG